MLMVPMDKEWRSVRRRQRRMTRIWFYVIAVLALAGVMVGVAQRLELLVVTGSYIMGAAVTWVRYELGTGDKDV